MGTAAGASPLPGGALCASALLSESIPGVAWGWVAAVSLWQHYRCAGVAFEDLAEIVCPGDPPGAERLSWAKAFFPGFGKTGMDLGAGNVGCGAAYFFEGLPVVKR